MRFPSFPFNSREGVPEDSLKVKELSLAQQARKEAIATLQKKLSEGVHPNAEVQKSRLTALTKLLANEFEDEHGDIAIPEDMMHFSASAANESHIPAQGQAEEDKKRA